MAAPAIRGRTAPVAGGVTASPAGTEVGDLVLVYTFERAGAGIPTFTLQNGFVELRNHGHDDGSTDGRLAVAYKIATQAGAQNYQAYTTSTGSPAWWTGCVVLTKGLFDVSAIVAPSGVTQTNTAVPDPPSATGLTAASDYLVLAIAAWHLGSGATVTPTAPTNYTNLDHISGSATAELACSMRAISGATSENPGSYGDDVAPNGTCAITVAIPDAPPEEGSGAVAVSLGTSGVGKRVAYSAAAAAALVLAVSGAGASVHKGSSAPALVLTAEGQGEAPVIDIAEGSGQSALTLGLAGVGYVLHGGAGELPLALETDGDGAATHAGHSGPALALAAEGTGETQRQGTGSAVLPLASAGTGGIVTSGDGAIALNVGTSGQGSTVHSGGGELALDELGVDGMGDAPAEGAAEGSGAVALALALEGLGESVRCASGSIAMSLDISGAGHTLTFGQGTAALTLSSHGYGDDGDLVPLPPISPMVSEVQDVREWAAVEADRAVALVERG